MKKKSLCGKDLIDIVFCGSTATETVLAAGTARFNKQEWDVRNPLVPHAKAHPPAQVSSTCWCSTRPAPKPDPVIKQFFFRCVRQQQWVSSSRKCRRQHSVCGQGPLPQWRVYTFLWGHAESSVLRLQRSVILCFHDERKKKEKVVRDVRSGDNTLSSAKQISTGWKKSQITTYF